MIAVDFIIVFTWSSVLFMTTDGVVYLVADALRAVLHSARQHLHERLFLTVPVFACVACFFREFFFWEIGD
jgi:hypothetical protein